MTELTTDRTDRPATDPAPLAAAYRQIRRNMADLLDEHDSALALGVATCPGWTVGDLLGHLVEVCARVNARVTGGGDPAPTGGGDPAPTGVASSGSVQQLFEAWQRYSGPVEMFLSEPFTLDRAVLVMDTFTHELDLRRALGVAPPIGHPAQPVAMEVLVKGFSAAVRARQLPAVRIETEHGQWLVGDGEPAAVASGSWYEIYLMLSGRRTEAQIRALQWSADPAPWFPAFTWGPFVMPSAVVEQ
ncbi:maleylpyruvate isomerase family mycothiol-dependent enzyme [Micromonospora sp. LOL_023]|uniref:maleylpyruvate isomerase family mycothiol-dependent enzyme n=1 Tax=Micromonospora sp. LOL_023 TaxID=3345418 RepID=UPI003A8A5073